MTDREAKEQIAQHAERLRLNGSIKKEMAQIARKQGRQGGGRTPPPPPCNY